MPPSSSTSTQSAPDQPSTSGWISEATVRHTTTLLICVVFLAAGNLVGIRVSLRAFALFGVWIALTLVWTPWAIKPHDVEVRVKRYALTLVMDVVFLGGAYIFLDGAQWLGAAFFMHSALVASATLPRRWSIGVAILILAVYSINVWFAVAGPFVVESPIGLPSVRGNWTWAFAAMMSALVLVSVLMLLQHRLVASIRDAEQRYVLLVQAAPDMVMTFDESGRFAEVNPATLTQTGYTWNEMKELPNTSFFPPEDWPTIVASRQRNLAGETTTNDIRYIRKSGEMRWLQTTSTPFKRAGDKPGVLVIARDVTEQKRQTDELRANDERFRLIIASLDLGFYTLDTAQRITALFGRWAQRQRDERHDLIGKRARDFSPPEVAEIHEAANLRALNGEDVTIQWSVTERPGDERHFRAHLAPMRDNEGRVTGIAGVWTDITDSRRAEVDHALLQERVADADRVESLGKLVSGVAHELNNPLAAILNFTEDLLVDARPEDERMALEVIQAQALRSRTIVRDLLTFVRKGDRRPRKLETPGPVLETLIRAVRPGFSTQGVTFTSTVLDPTTPLLLDRAGFEQVVTNLLTNAAHAAGAGGAVKLTAGCEGSRYVVTVEDDGPGIKPELVSRIFEPFFTTKPTGQGVGLGLSVSLGIMQAHGGELTAENRSPAGGTGARFIMRIPVAPADAADAVKGADTPRPKTPPGATRTNAATRPVRKPSLLVIDDEESIRRALRRYFERRGWIVDEAADGDEASAKLLAPDADSRFDVVLCDLKMPGVSGPDLYKRVVREAPFLATRMILSTGDASAHDVIDFLTFADADVDLAAGTRCVWAASEARRAFARIRRALLDGVLQAAGRDGRCTSRPVRAVGRLDARCECSRTGHRHSSACGLVRIHAPLGNRDTYRPPLTRRRRGCCVGQQSAHTHDLGAGARRIGQLRLVAGPIAAERQSRRDGRPGTEHLAESSARAGGAHPHQRHALATVPAL